MTLPTEPHLPEDFNLVPNRFNDLTPEDILDLFGSSDWVEDISEMHEKFGVNGAIEKLPREKLLRFLDFRIKFLEEELTELKDSYTQLAAGQGTVKDADDAVDALIDLCVVAIGTLDAFKVDSDEAWDRVLEANMSKEVGINPSRPNELGLPDLTKPAGWVAPTHADNIGLFARLLDEDKLENDE